MFELALAGIILVLFYVSLALFGADSRDGEDWFRHLR